MKIEIEIEIREGFSAEAVAVKLGEEIVGGGFGSDEETDILTARMRLLADEAVERANMQVAGRRMIERAKEGA